MEKILGFLVMALFTIVISSPGLSWADIIELKTGQRIEGSFIQATSAGVTIEVGGQTITFEQEKVRAIYFGSAPETIQKPSDRDEVLKSLRALQSVVAGGIDYRNYAPRVNDAKIEVDRYLSSSTSDPEAAKIAIQKAMGFYSLASSAWNAKISRANYEAVGANPLLGECPLLRGKIDSQTIKPSNEYERISLRGIGAGFHIPEIWSCASEKITEAEQLIPSK